jgi:hypothetical protein
MAYRRAKNLDKNLVFAEYFNSEQEVRRNGGELVENTGVFSFTKGMVKFPGGNNDWIEYPDSKHLWRAPFSIVVKIGDIIHSGAGVSGIYSMYATGDYINGVDLRVDGATGIYTMVIPGGFGVVSTSVHSVNDVIVCTFTNGSQKMYINGVLEASGFSALVNVLHPLRLGDVRVGGINYNGELDYIEVYNKALTAEEVSNLYNDARYVVPKLENEEQLGEELISDPYFNNAGAWVVSTNWTISGNGEAVYDNLSNGSFYHEDAVPIVVGKRYKLTFTVGDGLSLLLYPSRQIGVQAWNEFTTSDTYESNTTYSFYVTSLSGVATLGFRAYTGGNAGKLTYFSVKEVLVEPTSKILHVTAKDGVARNLLSGDVIGDSILVNDHFDDTSEWSLGDGWSIANGKASCDGTQSTFSVIEDLSCGTETGKEYNIVYKLSGVSAGTVRYVNAGGSNHYGDWISEDGVYQDTFISTGATFRMQADADFIGSVEYIIVQEIIPEVTNTDIEVVKDGQVRVPRFNGDTSKIDCGSYNDLTGDITVLAWIKYTEDDDEILAYRNAIFSNAKFGFAQETLMRWLLAGTVFLLLQLALIMY